MHNFKSYAKFKREYCLHITNKIPFYYLHIRPSPFSRNLLICPFPQAQYCHFKFPFKEHLHVHKSCTIRPNSIIDNRNKLLPSELWLHAPYTLKNTLGPRDKKGGKQQGLNSLPVKRNVTSRTKIPNRNARLIFKRLQVLSSHGAIQVEVIYSSNLCCSVLCYRGASCLLVNVFMHRGCKRTRRYIALHASILFVKSNFFPLIFGRCQCAVQELHR